MLINIKKFPDRKIELKFTSKMLSQIGLIGFILAKLSRARAKKLTYLKYG